MLPPVPLDSFPLWFVYHTYFHDSNILPFRDVSSLSQECTRPMSLKEKIFNVDLDQQQS